MVRLKYGKAYEMAEWITHFNSSMVRLKSIIASILA